MCIYKYTYLYKIIHLYKLISIEMINILNMKVMLKFSPSV